LSGRTIVLQHVDEQSGRCSYVLGCRRTAVAALIDPLPSLTGPLMAAVRQYGLRLRWVLNTRDALERVQRVGSGRPPPWEDTPRVGPLAASARAESLMIKAGSMDIGVRLASRVEEGTPRFTIGGTALAQTEGRMCGSARIAFGAFHIRILTSVTCADGVAYLVDDRLFTGGTLHAASSDAQPTAPELLWGLAPDTVVYAGRLVAGRSVSTIGQERRMSRDDEVDELEDDDDNVIVGVSSEAARLPLIQP